MPRIFAQVSKPSEILWNSISSLELSDYEIVGVERYLYCEISAGKCLPGINSFIYSFSHPSVRLSEHIGQLRRLVASLVSHRSLWSSSNNRWVSKPSSSRIVMVSHPGHLELIHPAPSALLHSTSPRRVPSFPHRPLSSQMTHSSSCANAKRGGGGQMAGRPA